MDRKMNQKNKAPSLFDDGQIGSHQNPMALSKVTNTTNLIDLLYDGFYIVFLLRNQYVPQNPIPFREKILDLLSRFEHQAQKLHFTPEDIKYAKYAYCALLDETIAVQTNERFFDLQNKWLLNPLQLSLFGSQLAGNHFFEILEELRSKGKVNLASLEVFHYCLLLGYQGKYRLESIESLNHLVARVGDEIDYLKGKKSAFSPFSAIPDHIKNVLHSDLPFVWIFLCLIIFALLTFTGLSLALNRESNSALSNYSNIISAPTEQANITIHLP
jgi:type VI secretion system protein ImpK